MSVNLSYHLKTELNYKYYSELISIDNVYLKKYRTLAAVKYSGYEPKEVEAIGKNIEEYQS